MSARLEPHSWCSLQKDLKDALDGMKDEYTYTTFGSKNAAGYCAPSLHSPSTVSITHTLSLSYAGGSR
jgi:hypothetical protein